VGYKEEVCILTFLKSLLGGFGYLFGSLFSFLGSAVQVVARMPMALLDLFGLVQPVPQHQAADEADAAAELKQHFGSALDKKAVTWSPEKKHEMIVRWCHWRTGVEPVPEPSLAGLTIRERLKLKAADELTVQALTPRTLSQIEIWFNSPKKALTPLTPSELASVHRQLRIRNCEGEQAFARSDAIGRDLEASREIRAAANAVEDDNMIRTIEEALNYRPRGPAYA
jgi:hypothetical protein